MLSEVPYVYAAERGRPNGEGPQRLIVLDATVIDVPVVHPELPVPVMTYETPGGLHRTVIKFADAFYEQAHDPRDSVALPNVRDAEAIFRRRHGFLGTANRAGRFALQESLAGLGPLLSSERDKILEEIRLSQNNQICIQGRAWIRVPEPVLVVSSYNSDQGGFMKSRGYTGDNGVVIEIKSLDPSQSSDGVAFVPCENVFNIQDMAGAQRHASQYGTPQLSREVATRRVLAQEFFYDRDSVLRNSDLEQIADECLATFEKEGMRQLPHESILKWLLLRDTFNTATMTGRRSLSVFEMESAKLEAVISPLCQFLACEKSHGRLDPETEDRVERALLAWNEELVSYQP